MRKIAMWMVWNVPLGHAAPYVMAFALNARFRKSTDEDRHDHE